MRRLRIPRESVVPHTESSDKLVQMIGHGQKNLISAMPTADHSFPPEIFPSDDKDL